MLQQEDIKAGSFAQVLHHCRLCRVLRQYMQQHGSQAKAIFLVAGQPKVGVRSMLCPEVEGCRGLR
jgi:hypothetical protein